MSESISIKDTNSEIARKIAHAEKANALIYSQTILKSQAISLPLSKIVKGFDPIGYENSESRYRLPFYQRDSQPKDEWSTELVISVLHGYSIGAIHTSEHITLKGKYYNIEDGRTRMIALKNFYNNEFSIKIGQDEDDEYYYDDLSENIQDIFKEYSISCVQIEPYNSDIVNKAYNRALADNFIKLQEGVQLGHYDHYWAWYENQTSELDGSPLVNYAVTLGNDNDLSPLFKWMGATNMNQRGNKNRKPITKVVSLAASTWKGNDSNDYAKEDFNGKRQIIDEDISDEDKTLIKAKLLIIQEIIQESLQKYVQQPREQVGDFAKNKFTATIIQDLTAKDGSMNEDDKKKWVSLITKIRKEKQKAKQNPTNYDWLETEVYKNLSKGAKQGNCNLKEIVDRSGAITDWWKLHKASGEE